MDTAVLNAGEDQTEQGWKRIYKPALCMWAGLTVVLGSMVYGFWSLEVREIQGRLHTELEHHVEASVTHLQEPLMQAHALMGALSSHQEVMRILQGKADVKLADQIVQTFIPIADSISEVRFMDVHGMEKLRISHTEHGLSVTPFANLTSRASSTCFLAASHLPEGRLYLSPLSVPKQAMAATDLKLPVLRLAMPIFNGMHRLGVMTLFLDGRALYIPHDLTPLPGSVRELAIDPPYVYQIRMSLQGEQELKILRPAGDKTVQPDSEMYGWAWMPHTFLPLGEAQQSLSWRITSSIDPEAEALFYANQNLESSIFIVMGELLVLVWTGLWIRNRRRLLLLERHQQSLVAQLSIDRQSLQAIDAGVVIVDMTKADQPIIDCNPAFERITGYARAETVGRNCRFLQGDDRQQEELAAIRHAIARKQGCQVTLRNYRKDGGLFYNQLHLSPILNKAGDLTHYIGIQHDVTLQVEEERQRDALQREVQALSQSLIRKRDERTMVWAQWLHDDIGQKLAAVSSMSNFLAQQALDEASLAAVRDIQQISQNLMTDVRKRLNALGPSYVEDIGLRDAIRRRLDGWYLSSHIQVDLHVSKAVEAMSVERKQAIMQTLDGVQRRIEEACPSIDSFHLTCSNNDLVRLSIVLGGGWSPETAGELVQTFASGATYALLIERLHSQSGRLHIDATSMGEIDLSFDWPADE